MTSRGTRTAFCFRWLSRSMNLLHEKRGLHGVIITVHVYDKHSCRWPWIVMFFVMGWLNWSVWRTRTSQTAMPWLMILHTYTRWYACTYMHAQGTLILSQMCWDVHRENMFILADKLKWNSAVAKRAKAIQLSQYCWYFHQICFQMT